MSAVEDTLAAPAEGRYLLVPRPAALSENPSGSNSRSYWDAPYAYRLWTVTLCVQAPDEQFISHNLQVKLGAPDLPRGRADAEVVLRLASGWWVTLRHEFAAAPRTATAIVASAANELSKFTALATDARGAEASRLAVDLKQRRFEAVGPMIWLGHD
jgi:hypothetical protein